MHHDNTPVRHSVKVWGCEYARGNVAARDMLLRHEAETNLGTVIRTLKLRKKKILCNKALAKSCTTDRFPYSTSTKDSRGGGGVG